MLSLVFLKESYFCEDLDSDILSRMDNSSRCPRRGRSSSFFDFARVRRFEGQASHRFAGRRDRRVGGPHWTEDLIRHTLLSRLPGDCVTG